jgi:TolB-like protein/Tfp pilus assembly protein PilF
MPIARPDRGSESLPQSSVAPGAVSALLRELVNIPVLPEAEPPRFQPGQVVGRFEILREIGRGGFGIVYEAKDRELGRTVAFKAVRVTGKLDLCEERLLQEAESAARLCHPNIVTLFDIGRNDEGVFLVYELLHGQTLARRFAHGTVPLREAVRIAVEVATGLAHAHAQGVVHRDLTPGNVFLCNDDQVKVLDFGMAHAFGRRKLDGGTRSYMAPEQARGAAEDERTDVFALGVVLYQMLSGELPFADDRALEDASPAPSLEIAEEPGLADLVAQMLEKDLVQRPRDAGEVLAALTSFQQELARAAAQPSSVPVRAKRRASSLAEFLDELKRRRVIRALIAYGIFSFTILQVIEPVMHGVHLPESMLSVVVALLGVGFPLTIALAWVFDVTARGITRTPAKEDRFRGARLALLLVGGGVLIALPGVTWYFLHRHGARPAETRETAAPSIAVLPFADMSSNHDQEYFADGVAEEILNALAHVEGLRVTGRTSSFSFKGKNEDVRSIGQKINVAHVLEGSVRKEGQHLRIMAQLVKVSDGYHVWSETFDRELTSIFAVQEEIARAVAAALTLTLLPETSPATSQRRTRSVEAYSQYLLGRQFHARQTHDGYRHAVEAYEKAVAIDPSYAPPHAQLAITLRAVGFDAEDRATAMTLRNRALAEAERAIALGPDLAEAYASRGLLRVDFLRDWSGAQSDFRRALELDPNDAPTYRRLGLLVASQGRLADALAAVDHATQLDPLDTTSWLCVGTLRAASGRIDLARAAQLRVLEIAPASEDAHDELAVYDLLEGRPAEALARVAVISKPERLRVVAIAEHDLGHAKESERALQTLIARYAHLGAESIAQVYAWRGEPDQAFDWLERGFREDQELWDVKLDPILRRLRGDPRYAALLRKMNLPLD